MPTSPFASVSLLKGSLLAIDTSNALNNAYVPFQYNPYEVSRTLTPQVYTKSVPSEVRFIGAPTQSISLTAYLTTIEEMDAGTEIPIIGIYPELANLENIIYPSADDVDAYHTAVNDEGERWAVPPKGPMVLFYWGPGRILPVNVKDISVKEDLFNTYLSPIRAEVSLKLDVVPVQDGNETQYSLQLVNLAAQQALAAVAMAKVGLSAMMDIVSAI